MKRGADIHTYVGAGEGEGEVALCVLKIENYQKENKNNSDNSVNNKLINVTATRERCEQEKGNYSGRRGREGGREGVERG